MNYDEQVTDLVLEEIADERVAQREQWGQQDWPTGVSSNSPSLLLGHSALPTWNRLCHEEARQRCQYLAERGNLNWIAILFEEVAEFAASTTDTHAREELVQVAAVAVAAIEAIDRRGLERSPTGS